MHLNLLYLQSNPGESTPLLPSLAFYIYNYFSSKKTQKRRMKKKKIKKKFAHTNELREWWNQQEYSILCTRSLRIPPYNAARFAGIFLISFPQPLIFWLFSTHLRLCSLLYTSPFFLESLTSSANRTLFLSLLAFSLFLLSANMKNSPINNNSRNLKNPERDVRERKLRFFLNTWR